MLVLTTFLDEHLVLRAVRAGARGYVVKDVDTSGLIRAIGDVAGARARSTPGRRRRSCAA